MDIASRIYRWTIHKRWKRKMQALMDAGMKVGKNVVIEAGVYIDARSPFLIEIGDNCAIAHGVRILSHDATGFKYIGGYTRLGRVHLKENVFIAENSIILPGVTIGPNVLIAPGSIINKDIPPNTCVAGIPARFYSKFDELLERLKTSVAERPVFKHEELYYTNREKEIARCREAVLTGDAFVQGFPGTYPYTLNPTK